MSAADGNPRLLANMSPMVIAPAVVRHFERVAALLAQYFAGIPLIATYYPDGIAGAAVYSGPLHHDVPPSIPTATATTPSGPHRYVACTKNSVEWLAHRGTIELGSWTSVAGASDRCAYARLLVHPSGRATRAMVGTGLRLVRERLQRDGLDGVALVDARGGAVWVPLGGAPSYSRVASWLHPIASDVLNAHPELFSDAPLSERGDRLYLGTASNHPGRFSALPYSATGEPGYSVLVPVAWDDLEAALGRTVGVADFAQWWDENDDLFGASVAERGEQHLPESVMPTALPSANAFPMPSAAIGESRGPNVRAAIAVLADGRARSCDEILTQAVHLGLLPASTPSHQLYVALIEYISRARGVGRVPQIVQDEERRFRLNEPADDWPQPTYWRPRLEPHPNAGELTAALRQSGGGADTTAFETAVCDGFAALGFVATHVGGQAAPDGYVDAPLGGHAYRAMLECKTARGTVANPDVAEAAKYRESYGAQFATLVGPAFPNEQTVINELNEHRVSAWTIDDLCELLALNANPEEVRDLFAPGFVDDRIASVRWSREHGTAKRVALICEVLCALGWRAQQHTPSDATDAPLLTEDAAMMLVDGFLSAAGAPVSCARSDVQAAFAYVTSPLVAQAVWTSGDHQSIVISAPPAGRSAGSNEGTIPPTR
ncbi:MAG: restriction endonuclease [Candidatus Eremiobacteraeota bacterium]|nr:restriction endonuclease [Candidatus Eremiobacteraeota bacterium]